MACEEVWLVRHGETEWSRDGKHTSTTDLSLTPEGEAVARTLESRLGGDFSLVLTSPRSRARETAALAGHPEAVTDDDLAEWDYGDYEGLTTPEIREQASDWSVWSHGCPGGESPDQISARLDRVIARARAADGRVLMFGHGHALRALTARWLDLPVANGRLFRLDTATISDLGYERDEAVVLHWNS